MYLNQQINLEEQEDIVEEYEIKVLEKISIIVTSSLNKLSFQIVVLLIEVSVSVSSVIIYRILETAQLESRENERFNYLYLRTK